MKKKLDPKRPLFITVERDGTPAEKQATQALDAALTKLVADYGYASVLRGIARMSMEAVNRPEKHADDTMLKLDPVRKECRLIGFRVYSVANKEKIRLRACDVQRSACYVEVTPNGKFRYHRDFLLKAKKAERSVFCNEVIGSVEEYEERVGSILATMNKASHKSEVLNPLGRLLSLLEHIDRQVRSLVIV